MSVGEHSAGTKVGRRWPITAGRGLLVVGLVAAGLTLLLGHAMVAPFGHDEHQFVFSGQLLADQALLPYLDFPYNHSPYLVFLYGALFKLTDFDLLAARAISALGALATAAMLYGACWRAAEGETTFWKYWISAGAVVILLANPIFQSTTGKAWNHDVAGALALGRCCFCLGAARGTRSGGASS